jgi:membrane-associated phospholipid phosphatase
VARLRSIPLLAAAACLAGLVLVAVVALAVPAAHERDAAMLHGFMTLDRPGVHFEVMTLAHFVDVVPYTCAALILVAVALVRGRRWRAGAVAALVLVTGATTQLLKHAVATARPEGWMGEQLPPTSWPSGHSTAAMTLALCAVLVAPPALRGATALAGGAFAVGVGYALAVLGWHFPSDVLGGFLVAGFWTSLAVAALQRVEEPEPASRAAWEPLVAVVAGVLLAGIVVAGERAGSAVRYAAERPTLALGALGIAALGLALVVSAASLPGARRVR